MSGSIALHSKGKLTGMKARVLTVYLKADYLVCRANRQSYTVPACPPTRVGAGHPPIPLGFRSLFRLLFCHGWLVPCLGKVKMKGKESVVGPAGWVPGFLLLLFHSVIYVNFPGLTWVTSWIRGMEEVPLVRGDLKEGPRKLATLLVIGASERFSQVAILTCCRWHVSYWLHPFVQLPAT